MFHGLTAFSHLSKQLADWYLNPPCSLTVNRLIMVHKATFSYPCSTNAIWARLLAVGNNGSVPGHILVFTVHSSATIRLFIHVNVLRGLTWSLYVNCHISWQKMQNRCLDLGDCSSQMLWFGWNSGEECRAVIISWLAYQREINTFQLLWSFLDQFGKVLKFVLAEQGLIL